MARREKKAAGVIGYVRVSTTEQADRGVSLDAQRQRLKAYCEAHGLALLRVEEDAGVSARRTSRRPAWQKALEERFYLRATRGLLLMRQGAIEEGARLYEEAQTKAPDDHQRERVAQKRGLELGRALLARGEIEQARALLEEAAQGPDRVFGDDARALLVSGHRR